jgi:hypothetical protein
MQSDLAPTSDLGTWVRQQVDEDERVARAAAGGVTGVWVASVTREGTGGVNYGPGLHDWPNGGNGIVVYDEGCPNAEEATHIARHDPARTFREVEAKQRIISIHRRPQVDLWSGEPFKDCCDGCGYSGAFGAPNVRHIGDCPELRALAAVYSDRPGYDDEWRPAPMPPSDS